jgi:hypothetical protein
LHLAGGRKGAGMVLAGFFKSFTQRRLARFYAARLPGLLAEDYGASETYSDAQITACVCRAKLPEAGLPLARAAYLPEPVFLEVYGVGQAGLRQLFRNSLPRHVSEQHSGQSDWGNASVPDGWSP